MKKANIYEAVVTQIPEDLELEPIIVTYKIVAHTIKEVILTLTEASEIKEEEITSISYLGTINYYQYL